MMVRQVHDRVRALEEQMQQQSVALERIHAAIVNQRADAAADSGARAHSVDLLGIHDQEDTQAPPLLAVPPTPLAGRHPTIEQLPDNQEKKEWYEIGVERGYAWAFPPPNRDIEDLCYGDYLLDNDNLAVVCTAGTTAVQAQCAELTVALRGLGWKVLVIRGVHPNDMPPKSWKIGCKASFAWWAQLAPTIVRIATALPCHKPFLVCEDSMWPTTACTPRNLAGIYTGKPLWLGCYLKPRLYRHWFAGVSYAGRSAAGAKLFLGDATFWTLVNLMFRKTDKGFCTDAVFQTLVGMEKLKFVYPVYGTTRAHWSERCAQLADASPQLDCVGEPVQPR